MLTRRAVVSDLKVEAASSRDFIGQPLDGIALLLPLALDIGRGGLQRLMTENVTLADLAGKLLNVHPKVLRQRLLLAGHGLSVRSILML